jgi:hypothetical protein
VIHDAREGQHSGKVAIMFENVVPCAVRTEFNRRMAATEAAV